MAEKEESMATSKSSRSDTKFDVTIGYIEDIIMEDEFQSIQTDFMEKHYHEFDDTEENKLCYTDIHKAYTDLVERYICSQLTKLLPNFSMDEFQKQLISRKNELEGEIFEMLVTFSDFLAFKEMMLDFKAEKEGRSIDLSSGFTVTSLSVGDGQSFGLTGTSINHQDLVVPEDMAMDDCNQQPETNGMTSQNTDTSDVTMESPR